VKPANDVAFFAVKLAALVAFGMWGWHVGSGAWRFVLVVALPLAFAVAWGLSAAPTASYRLADPSLIVFQLVAFLLAAAALWATGRTGLGAVAVAVVVLDRVLS
jgi:hypothetical protein